MKRTIKKQIWLSQAEDKLLKEKSQKACLTEAAMIRMLIKGYLPKEKPDIEFYQMMDRIAMIGRNLNQLVTKAHSLGIVDLTAVKQEIESLKVFRLQIEKKYIEPEKDGSY